MPVNVKANLPIIIEVSDYHDFDYLAEHLKAIIPGVKIREVIREVGSGYIGLVYIGALTDNANAKLLKELKEGVQNESE